MWRPVAAARPMIDAFVRSPRCPEAHRGHARTSLALVALYVCTLEENDSRGLPWHRLDPDALASASLEQVAGEDAPDLRFLGALLDLSAAFYGFLADRGVLRREEAMRIRLRLVELALGFR